MILRSKYAKIEGKFNYLVQQCPFFPEPCRCGTGDMPYGEHFYGELTKEVVREAAKRAEKLVGPARNMVIVETKETWLEENDDAREEERVVGCGAALQPVVEGGDKADEQRGTSILSGNPSNDDQGSGGHIQDGRPREGLRIRTLNCVKGFFGTVFGAMFKIAPSASFDDD